jgi:ketosteroid isomerase-like protein
MIYSIARMTFILVVVSVFVGSTQGQTKVSASQNDFESFLTNLDAAQLELQNGKAQPFKSLWSTADDITLSGGFGGTIEKGWDAISKRLDWVGQQFSNGTNKIERLVSVSHGNLGYVVQLEHIRFNVPGQSTESTKDYRVTMIFRKEKGSWRIVHRQADSNMTKQAPK